MRQALRYILSQSLVDRFSYMQLLLHHAAYGRLRSVMTRAKINEPIVFANVIDAIRINILQYFDQKIKVKNLPWIFSGLSCIFSDFSVFYQ